jgi:ABC-type sulfate transport system substrate-binding protein
MSNARSLAAALIACVSLALGSCGKGPSDDATLLNASYDPTRELYAEINVAFAKHWKETTGRPFASTSRTAVRAARRARSSMGCPRTW